LAQKKQQLVELSDEHTANKETYVAVMKEIAGVECEIKRVTTEIGDLTEELSGQKYELDKTCEEYKSL